jgi:hypothetical protein
MVYAIASIHIKIAINIRTKTASKFYNFYQVDCLQIYINLILDEDMSVIFIEIKIVEKTAYKLKN